MDAPTTTLIVLKELAGHPPVTLDPVQQFIMAHYAAFSGFWIGLWCVTGVVLLVKLWYAYRRQQ